MRIVSFCLIAAAFITFAGRLPASAVPYDRDEPSGSYKDSCVSIQLRGGYLTAKCQDVNGNWHVTQLDMDQCPGGPVANNNGALACGPGGYGISARMPRGSWRASCRDADQDGTVLTARCDNGSGGWNQSRLDMSGCPSDVVDNARGNLVCRGGYAYGLPPGTWRTTCRNGSMRGPVVFAECNNGYGSWQQTSYDLRQCPGGSLGNNHGYLICERRILRWPQ